MIDLVATTAQLATDGLAVTDLAVLDARHADRPVLQGMLDGRAVVVKCHGDVATAAAGHRAATQIWCGSSGQGAAGVVPEPLGWSPTAGAVVSERFAGVALGARGDLGGALDRADDVAHLLARLHGVPAGSDGSIERRDLGGIARSTRRKAASLPAPTDRLALEVADAIAATPHDRDDRDDGDGALVVSHGDFTPRNLLVGPTGELRLIDLDRVRRAPAGRDVGYWRAWCWATQLMAGAPPRWADTDGFVSAYLGHRGAAAMPVVDSLHVHTAAGLVRIAHGWSALAVRPDLQDAMVEEAAALVVGDPVR